MDDLPKRKHPRLKKHNYGCPGSYFITVCTLGKKHLLSKIVGRGDLTPPDIALTPIGRIVDTVTLTIPTAYPHVALDAYVIMPNHIHLLLTIRELSNGGVESPHPTIPGIVKGWKALITRQLGHSIWQTSYYDHVIRGPRDYEEILQYIRNNPAKWHTDTFYLSDGEEHP